MRPAGLATLLPESGSGGLGDGGDDRVIIGYTPYTCRPPSAVIGGGGNPGGTNPGGGTPGGENPGGGTPGGGTPGGGTPGGGTPGGGHPDCDPLSGNNPNWCDPSNPPGGGEPGGGNPGGGDPTNPVPLPGGLALMFAGLLGLAGTMRRIRTPEG